MGSKQRSLRSLVLVFSIGSACWMVGASAPGGTAAPTDAGEQMIAILASQGPSPELGDQAKIWDRFVGTWDTDYSFIAADGKVTHAPGELEFGWVLDGMAIQDLWISYPRAGQTERTIGTSLRYYDAKAKLWHVVFVAPKFGATLQVEGGAEGDRIVLHGNDGDGSSLRWSFNDIQPASFTWRGERSRDGGKTWQLEEEHHMRRRAQADGSKAARAFERLASLVGDWRGVISGTQVDVTYELTANGSALTEEFRPKDGPAMTTLFTVDGDHLLATHYCSAKNQPQMASAAIADPEARSLAFSLVRVTGLRSSDDWHNTGLVVTLEDRDHLTQDWTYQEGSKTGATSFHFTRVR